jgi:hypothetical protein
MPKVTGSDGVNALEVAEAAIKSSAKNQVVQLDYCLSILKKFKDNK